MDFNYNNISNYYDQNYWDTPGVKSGYVGMTDSVGGEWHRQACAWFNSVIPIKGKKLFDTGCGLGHFMVAFKELGADVYGCDVSNYCARSLKNRFGNKFYQTPMEEMRGVPQNTFDIVFCTSTMEHIPKNLVERVFINLIKICKPGGTIYIEIDTTPNNQKPVPEASHVNIRSWPLWLLEINRPPYWWNHDYTLELKLRKQTLFPGFPHPDWKFAVMKKIPRKMQ